jgi:hypothetical protein
VLGLAITLTSMLGLALRYNVKGTCVRFCF